MTKILLVEDDKSLREIYGVRLLAEGYDIISAGDGEEALAMAIKERPDLIVSDVMMPKISGFDMLDILRSTTETKDIKVIMMTALSSEEQRQRGVNLGADRYLVKSQVGIEDVVRTVHEVLGDAPVTGQSPLMSANSPATPAPNFTPAAAAPQAPAFSPQPAPVAAAAFTSPVPARPTTSAPPAYPAPAAPPAATPVEAASAPAPNLPPVVPPTPATTPPTPPPLPPQVPGLPNSVLPQPTAPFSTPRPGSLASRVINPLDAPSEPAPDFSSLINKELESIPAPTLAPEVAFQEAPIPNTPAPAAGPMPPVTSPTSVMPQPPTPGL